MKFKQYYYLVSSAVKYDYINELLFFDALETDEEGSPQAQITPLHFIAPPKIRKLIREGDWLRVVNIYKESDSQSYGEKDQEVGYKIEAYDPKKEKWDFIYEEIKSN